MDRKNVVVDPITNWLTDLWFQSLRAPGRIFSRMMSTTKKSTQFKVSLYPSCLCSVGTGIHFPKFEGFWNLWSAVKVEKELVPTLPDIEPHRSSLWPCHGFPIPAISSMSNQCRRGGILTRYLGLNFKKRDHDIYRGCPQITGSRLFNQGVS